MAPGARTQAQAERAENQIREAIYERRYDPGKKLFSEFVDETFLPWSKANKRSHAKADGTHLMIRQSRVPKTTKRRQVAALQRIAPSSRHLAVEQLSHKQPDAVSVRTLAS